MGRLVYSMAASLDGCTEDESGDFSWAMPDAEVHRFFNDLERPMGVHLYGRRMYETMTFWEDPELEGEPAEMADFAQVWQAADKVVYSTTLAEVTTKRTRLERAFDPVAVRAMKESEERDLAIGGPTLAAEALRAGLVDEINLVLFPVVVGGGVPVLPDGLRVGLRLLDERRFGSGVVHLRYAVEHADQLDG